jgi:hypothetical protein
VEKPGEPRSGWVRGRTHLQHFNNVQSTHYQHDEEVSEESGRYLMDCSEFVSYVLGQVAPQHLALISRQTPHPSPLAFEYYDYFSSLEADSNGWQPIDKIADVQRGDIMTWLLVDHPEKGRDTGHVLLVAGAPKRGEDGKYEVRTYDSSDIPHNEDSRQDSATGSTGVGSGMVKFGTDPNGRPTSFQFKVHDCFIPKPIAVARLVMISEPASPPWLSWRLHSSRC